MCVRVYVLPSGESKIGLVPESQSVRLHSAWTAQKKQDEAQKNPGGGFLHSSGDSQGGRNMLEKKERKKESRNCVWLCRFCTRQLPICACLSPFLHVKPFSDVLFEYLLYLCKGHVTAIILSVYYQMTHVMSVLSWTHQRAGSFVVWKVRGGERVQREGEDWGEKKKYKKNKTDAKPEWTR